MSQVVKSSQIPVRESVPSRVLPLAVAGVFCFLVAVMTGTFSWYFFWLPPNRPSVAAASAPPENFQNQAIREPEKSEPVAAGASAPTQESQPSLPPGNVIVQSGEVVLGGDANRPIERFFVDEFAILETEVTNGEYAEFIRETGHSAPPGWNGPKFPVDTANFPVVNVSWKDAVDFCAWKSKKLGLTVRLPSEAEWEYAARGPERLKYPWGAEWNKDAAISKETGGKVSAVKTFPINRSTAGAYDMVGNVWEWVSDEVKEGETASDSYVESARKKERKFRLVKGGCAEESSSEMDAQLRYEVPENTKVKVIGFRYIVLMKDPA